MSPKLEQLADALAPLVSERVAEQLADRLAELVDAVPAPVEPELIDAAEVARRFAVSRDYVYDSADRLGAIRLGDGPKARLRFDPARVAAALGTKPEPVQPRAKPPPRRVKADVALLPIGPKGPRP